MLTRVEARTRQGTLLSMPLDDVSNGFTVESIDGLGPVNATLVTSSFADEDGEQYHSSRREARDVKLNVGLESDYTSFSVADLRKQLYSFFMPKSEVFLRFIEDDVDEYDIVGRVETCDPDIFSKDPRMNISVHCFNPDFVVPEPIVLAGMTVETNTEEDITTINYPGNIDTGVILTVEIDRPESAFTVYNQSSGDVLQQLDFSTSLVVGDIVRISTVTGDKGATLTRAGVETSVLYGVTPQSSWINLKQGDNDFRVYATGTPMRYTLEYVIRHGGL